MICARQRLSLWHTTQLCEQWHSARTLILTSPFCGGPTTTVVTSSGFSASQAMAAVHSMGWPLVDCAQHTICLCALLDLSTVKLGLYTALARQQRAG